MTSSLSIESLISLFCAVVNNHRVLHGRSAFTGKRRMCGAYIGVDEYRSKLAVLTEQFSGKEPISAEVIASHIAPMQERSVWSPLL